MKRVIFVETDDARRYPPEISVLNAISEIDYLDMSICSLCPSDYVKDFCEQKKIKCINADGKLLWNKTYRGIRIIYKLFDYLRNKILLWKAIEHIYENGDILWINSYDTLKMLGRKVKKYKFVVHLFELLHETRVFYKVPFIRVNLEQLLKSAYKVIECEYNRACITQVWFDLKERPIVMPNKLYLGMEKHDTFIVDKSVADLLEKLGNKKIILYQGILGPERPIDVFAEAISELGEEYVMLIMSSTKMMRRYDNVYEIGFVNPPQHLYVTQRAYIGILFYQANKSGFAGNDCLNSIYCAPNKIFEYSKYGLPMIGNDIPGLQYSIEINECGVCISEPTKSAIKNAILQIDANYKKYQRNSFKFYDAVDIKNIIENKILLREDA